MTERRYGGEVEPVEILDRRAGVRCECKCRLVDSSGSLPVSHLSASLHLIGLISDTHGLIRPEALDALRDSDLIIHCGDIGDPAVLEALRTIAPVRAIRGNNDKDGWARNLPTEQVVEVGNRAIYVIHNLSELELDPNAAGFTVIVSGHSHKPVIEKRGKILFINPGSAGPRRFSLPVSVATLAMHSHRCEAEIVQLVLSQQGRTHRRTAGAEISRKEKVAVKNDRLTRVKPLRS